MLAVSRRLRRLPGARLAARAARRPLRPAPRPHRQLLALGDAELIAALGGKARAEIERDLARFEPAAARRRAETAGLALLCSCQRGYPPTLRELESPPAVLHIAGDPELVAAGAAVAIVGSRRPSAYGNEVAHMLARGRRRRRRHRDQRHGAGIDAAAHRGCPERRRRDRGGARRRRRARLPGAGEGASSADRRRGGGRLRAAAGNGDPALDVPGPQSPDRGTGGDDRGRRGAPRLGRAVDRRRRARARSPGRRRAGADHLAARARAARTAAHGRPADRRPEDLLDGLYGADTAHPRRGHRPAPLDASARRLLDALAEGQATAAALVARRARRQRRAGGAGRARARGPGPPRGGRRVRGARPY